MSDGGRMPTRVLVALVLAAALALAGGLSIYASDRPDGLERVAEDEGFAGEAQEHPGSDSPLADYGDDPRVGGIVGVLVVLVLTSGTVYLLRRGRSETAERS